MAEPDYLPFRAQLADYLSAAESLFDALRANDESAAWRFKWSHPTFKGGPVGDVRAATLDLDDARAVIAAEYSFRNWAELANYAIEVGNVGPVERFESAVEAVVSGDLETLRALLVAHPELARSRSSRRHGATLLHYVAANGVENVRQKTPPNAIEVARALLDAGAEVDALADLYDAPCRTLSLLLSSCHPAEAGLQVELAETLVEFGAVLDGSAILTALQFGYGDTAAALARRLGPVPDLALAAGLGRTEVAARLLPDADDSSRHVALALAAMHGHTEIVSLLLDAGVDPNRYNPKGYHDHSTPLHQAALTGHIDVVRLLVERGARLDLRDTIYDGTPLDWAVHGGHTAIAAYLRSRVKT